MTADSKHGEDGEKYISSFLTSWDSCNIYLLPGSKHVLFLSYTTADVSDWAPVVP